MHLFAVVPGRVGRTCTLFIAMASILAGSWVSAAAGQRPLGIDVSHFQGVIDWNQVYAGGRTFAFVRATHGSINDTKFLANIVGARDAGVLAGAYHFAVPVYDANYDMPGADPETEATRFLARARDFIVPGYLRPVLDVELGGGQTPVGAANLSAWSNAWIDSVERQTGVEAIVYCSSNYARNYLNSSMAGRRLWIANWTYPSDPNTASLPANGTGVWSTWNFWQYSNSGNSAGHPSVPGVPARVDLNVFNGTAAQLQSFVISRSAVISPAPSSLSQTIRQRTSAVSQTFTIQNTGTGGLVYNIYPNREWMTVTPNTGFIKTGTNTITVSYAAASLPAGTHTAAIILTGDLAGNSPRNVDVTLTVQPIPGDFNGDGNIDSSDVGLFVGCLTGADQETQAPECVAMDLDSDDDVDQSDFARLQLCLSGTGIAADPACAP